MNTLLTTVFSTEANISSKAHERRTQPESKQSEENSFAGALANQIQPQESTNTAASKSNTDHSNTATSAANNTQATATNNHENKEVKSEQIPNQASNKLDGGLQAGNNEPKPLQINNIDRHATNSLKLQANIQFAPSSEQNNKLEKSDLPQRFQQIIASLQQGRSIEPAANTQTVAEPKQINVQQPHTELASTPQNSTTWQHQSRLEPTAKTAALANELAQSKHNATGQDFKRGATLVEGGLLNASIENTDKLANSNSYALNSHGLNTQANPEAISSVTAPQNIMASVAPISELASTPTALNGAIAKPVFSANWGADMSRQVVSMIRTGTNGSHVAELRLDPPELGPLRVTINLNDNVIQAMFSSAHASVRNAVEQALPQLQQQLQQEGLSLGEANVGHEENPQKGPEVGHKFASSDLNTRSNTNEAPLLNETSINRPSSDALIDTFA